MSKWEGEVPHKGELNQAAKDLEDNCLEAYRDRADKVELPLSTALILAKFFRALAHNGAPE